MTFKNHEDNNEDWKSEIKEIWVPYTFKKNITVKVYYIVQRSYHVRKDMQYLAKNIWLIYLNFLKSKINVLTLYIYRLVDVNTIHTVIYTHTH